MINRKNIAIYVHWPFCLKKCHYCDFNSHVRDNIDQNQWLEAYLREITSFANQLQNRTISSIFFGGGTPSLMPPKTTSAIIDKLASIADFAPDIEITLEGNPTSIEAEKYVNFKNAGVNRVSLGVQSLYDDELKFLSREHSVSEAIKAIEIAKNTFDNYSFDLIYARPNQTLKAWETELKMAIDLSNNHLSLYQLTIEKGTKFYSSYNKGEFKLPDVELSADLYELTRDMAYQAGLECYEVSNYATAGYESAHNMTYWNYGDYLGFGAGAHSRLKIDDKKTAIMMIHSPENWLKSVFDEGAGVQYKQKISQRELFEEIIMMGLRTKKGILHSNFEYETGQKITDTISSDTLYNLQENKLIEFDKLGLRATKKGLMLLNSLTNKLIND